MQKFPLMSNNISRQDLDKVIDHLKGDDPILTNGPKCKAFEDAWSEWLGVKYSVFVSSGSAANLISMAILKTKHPNGGEVIVPTLTWVSDIASVIQNGFTPVFCDINPTTLAMDEKEVLMAITDQTRAVFLTHAQGFNGLTDKLLSELNTRKIPLIEDVCESHGATHNGKKAGSLGVISNFSFYYAHHMTTIEGGMVCTDDHYIYQQARMFRSHGMIREATDAKLIDEYKSSYPDLNPEFIFAFPAYNLRNNELGAIIGLNQLPKLDSFIEKRSRNQEIFFEHIDASKYQTDFLFEGSSNYAFNLILKNKDDELMKRLESALKENSIEYRRGSAGGGNQTRQPYIKSLSFSINPEDYPNTEHVHFYGMYIGNFPSLGRQEIEFICSVINSA